jgi:hypothetical protein
MSALSSLCINFVRHNGGFVKIIQSTSFQNSNGTIGGVFFIVLHGSDERKFDEMIRKIIV